MNKPHVPVHIGVWDMVAERTPIGRLEFEIDIFLKGMSTVVMLSNSQYMEFEMKNVSLTKHMLTGDASIMGYNLYFSLEFSKNKVDGKVKSGLISVPINGVRTHFRRKKNIREITKEIMGINHPMPPNRTTEEIDQLVDNLIKQMTLEEKIGQLYQAQPTFIEAITGSDEVTGGIKECYRLLSGSILNSPAVEVSYSIQKEVVENSRLGIPVLFMYDVIHGFRTIFPVPLGLACSWNPDILQTVARISAIEASVFGINVTFSPMCDISRDPRWGRIVETFGESGFLTGVMTRAFIDGYHGKESFQNKSKDFYLATCAKHFAGYGFTESGRDYNTVDVSKFTLFNKILSPFEIAIKQNTEFIMTSYSALNRIPPTSNIWLLKSILRKTMGFEGLVISDFNAVSDLISHGVANNLKDAGIKAFNAGTDIEMESTGFISGLKEGVESGIVDENSIDTAVKKLLRLKYELGLFDDPYRYLRPSLIEKYHLCEVHRDAALKAAIESTVLLKNDGILPLNKNMKVALIGPMSETGDILGPWRAFGDSSDTVTIYDSLKKYLGINKLKHSKGCELDGEDRSLLAAAIKTAQKSDVIILAIGEDQELSGEAASLSEIRLRGIQEELAYELRKLKKPIISIVIAGRPLDLRYISEASNALLYSFHPGTEGGNAMRNLLYGIACPSGKLSISIPYTTGQIPVYHDYLNTGRMASRDNINMKFVSRFVDIPNEPLYHFGYGLSYTKFKYEDLAVTRDFGDLIKVTVKVTNIGDVRGKEVVQLYIGYGVSKVSRPIKELMGFEKISINPGETKILAFIIDQDKLGYIDSNSFDGLFERHLDEGEYSIMVGGSSRDEDLLKMNILL